MYGTLPWQCTDAVRAEVTMVTDMICVTMVTVPALLWLQAEHTWDAMVTYKRLGYHGDKQIIGYHGDITCVTKDIVGAWVTL